LRKLALVLVFAISCTISARCQDDIHGYGGVSSFGISTTYSPDSSHILIGDSGQRRIWTAGGEYTHRLRVTPLLRLDYEGSILPIFEETDPTVTGTLFTTTSGQAIVTSQTPVRVLHTDSHPVGAVLTGSGATVPLYALFGKQNTYAAAVTPLGVRLSAMPRWIVQPSLALDLGFVISARDIPLDNSSQFNYMFAIGPGLQFFNTPHTSLRAEYLYRHISNAGQGAQNPGIDQGVIRLTVSVRR
jgi:opacity protein-like surface antigen